MPTSPDPPLVRLNPAEPLPVGLLLLALELYPNLGNPGARPPLPETLRQHSSSSIETRTPVPAFLMTDVSPSGLKSWLKYFLGI